MVKKHCIIWKPVGQLLTYLQEEPVLSLCIENTAQSHLEGFQHLRKPYQVNRMKYLVDFGLFMFYFVLERVISLLMIYLFFVYYCNYSVKRKLQPFKVLWCGGAKASQSKFGASRSALRSATKSQLSCSWVLLFPAWLLRVKPLFVHSLWIFVTMPSVVAREI